MCGAIACSIAVAMTDVDATFVCVPRRVLGATKIGVSGMRVTRGDGAEDGSAGRASEELPTGDATVAGRLLKSDHTLAHSV